MEQRDNHRKRYWLILGKILQLVVKELARGQKHWGIAEARIFKGRREGPPLVALHPVMAR